MSMPTHPGASLPNETHTPNGVSPYYEISMGRKGLLGLDPVALACRLNT